MKQVQSLLSEILISSHPPNKNSHPPNKNCEDRDEDAPSSVSKQSFTNRTILGSGECCTRFHGKSENAWMMKASTNVGLRANQEDRCFMLPHLLAEDSLLGVFDGTVGDFVSQYAQENFGSTISRTQAFQSLARAIADQQSNDNKGALPRKRRLKLMREALKQAFVDIDEKILQECEKKQLHWAASTAVVVWLYGDTITVAHLGDSKACLGRRQKDGQIEGRWMTRDHKPNMALELSRIQQMGGSLVWLHGGKPYLRGADFLPRQKEGQHPKQLNYSRALGGKDLKRYGLSSEPSILQYQRGTGDCVLILGSDGLWDAVPPDDAVAAALRAHRRGRSAADALVELAIQEMPRQGVYDNVTAVVVIFPPTGASTVSPRSQQDHHKHQFSSSTGEIAQRRSDAHTHINTDTSQQHMVTTSNTSRRRGGGAATEKDGNGGAAAPRRQQEPEILVDGPSRNLDSNQQQLKTGKNNSIKDKDKSEQLVPGPKA
mmetsp:Transcript_10683/g.17631  ORF Transcript_10683/g.17631 Transcript_10683/m.17631 type:complete len:488 (+) Transcript_10683:2-1465(+)